MGKGMGNVVTTNGQHNNYRKQKMFFLDCKKFDFHCKAGHFNIRMSWDGLVNGVFGTSDSLIHKDSHLHCTVLTVCSFENWKYCLVQIIVQIWNSLLINHAKVRRKKTFCA